MGVDSVLGYKENAIWSNYCNVFLTCDYSKRQLFRQIFQTPIIRFEMLLFLIMRHHIHNAFALGCCGSLYNLALLLLVVGQTSNQALC